MNTIRDAFWIMVLGLVACFAFFFTLGAISTEAVGLIAVMTVLTAMWVGHAWVQSRHHDGRDPRITHDRERRGF